MAFEKYLVKKDPNSIIDYGRKWFDWLEEDELILSSIWIISSEEDNITLKEDSTGISLDGKNTSIWLSGGTDKVRYNLTNRITTDKERTEDRTGVITVGEK